jgi:MFS family permease
MVCYGITIAAAPTLGPIIGGAFIARGCGWRWTEYLTGIVMIVQFFLDVLWLDESHADVLLARKAHGLRRATGNFVFHTKVSGSSGRPGSVVSLTNDTLLLNLSTYSGKRQGRPSETSSASILSALCGCFSIRFACC